MVTGTLCSAAVVRANPHRPLTARRCAAGMLLSAQCANNLKQISVALHAYDNHFHSFPPVYVADKGGKPMHSWRVLILPYLGQKELYDQYDFEEPWNGPNNRKLSRARPSEYVCPADEGAHAEGATQTSYAAVVGLNAAWGKEQPRTLGDDQLCGHASTTVVLAEIASDIDWMEPRDISLDALQSKVLSPGVVTVSSEHGCYRHDLFYDYECDTPYVANVAMADGSTYAVPANILSTTKLPDLLKIGGFKKDEIEYSDTNREPQFRASLRWRTCFAAVVWLVSVGLLLCQAVRSRKTAQKCAGQSDR